MTKVVEGLFERERVMTENSDVARELFEKSRFGALLKEGNVALSHIEALYLVEEGRLVVRDGWRKVMSAELLLRRVRRGRSNFRVCYRVFADLRSRGYIVKTALKFGAEFRVYDRGVKPGEDHARWVVFPVHESEALTWHAFAAKNRVAHSTKKRLLIGVVDDEGDVSYWEVRWLRP